PPAARTAGHRCEGRGGGGDGAHARAPEAPLRATGACRRGEAVDASELARLHQAVRSPWWQWHNWFEFCLVAGAYGRAGMPDRGLATLRQIPEQAAESVYEPEIHRCRGRCFSPKAMLTRPRQRSVSAAPSTWPGAAVIARSSYEPRR